MHVTHNIYATHILHILRVHCVHVEGGFTYPWALTRGGLGGWGCARGGARGGRRVILLVINIEIIRGKVAPTYLNFGGRADANRTF